MVTAALSHLQPRGLVIYSSWSLFKKEWVYFQGSRGKKVVIIVQSVPNSNKISLSVTPKNIQDTSDFAFLSVYSDGLVIHSHSYLHEDDVSESESTMEKETTHCRIIPTWNQKTEKTETDRKTWKHKPYNNMCVRIMYREKNR